jgi:hypothetical protein
MSALSLHPEPSEPTVFVDGGLIRFSGFVETDPDVVSVIAEADSPEGAAHTLLRIGGQAVAYASMDLDTSVVDRRFDGMTAFFGSTLDRIMAELTEATNKLLDEESGTLPAMVGSLHEQLSATLGETFDADSKSSVIAKLERILTTTAEQLGAKVKATLSLDEPESPLARTKRELAEVVKGEVGNVQKEVREISLALAGKAAAAAVIDKSTAKGATFEEFVAGTIDQLAGVHGDIAERVGTTVGSAGTKKGDHLVTVNRDDTCGLAAKFVAESKNTPLSMSKAMAELDAALANHDDAQAAILVFGGKDQIPLSLPFWYSGNRAIVVLDRDEPDPGFLRLAYEWARWVTRRSLAEDGDAVNVVEVEAAIKRVRGALTKHAAVKACHSGIKKKTDEAGLHVAALVEEIDLAMKALSDALNS